MVQLAWKQLYFKPIALDERNVDGREGLTGSYSEKTAPIAARTDLCIFFFRSSVTIRSAEVWVWWGSRAEVSARAPRCSSRMPRITIRSGKIYNGVVQCSGLIAELLAKLSWRIAIYTTLIKQRSELSNFAVIDSQ